MSDLCFVLIKPDAIERGLIGRIVQRFEDKCLRLEWCGLRYKSAAWVRKHYGTSDLVSFLAEASIIGLLFSGERAVDIAQRVVGNESPHSALPGTVRGDFAISQKYNCVDISRESDQALLQFELFNDVLTDHEANS